MLTHSLILSSVDSLSVSNTIAKCLSCFHCYLTLYRLTLGRPLRRSRKHFRNRGYHQTLDQQVRRNYKMLVGLDIAM
jgi:hypothetical protein